MIGFNDLKKYMYKYYSLLFLILFFIDGCQVAGGGGYFYQPPKEIVCDRPWTIRILFVVTPRDPKEKLGKLTERYKDITIHFHDYAINEFISIPMVVESANTKTGQFQMKAEMKPIPCDSDEKYVDYYIDFTFKGIYNSSKHFIIPVIKK